MSLEFSTSPDTKGDVYATTFVFKKTTLPSYTITTWDFGDGNFVYNQEEVSHVYNFPGVYKVALSAWSEQGSLETFSELIDVDYILRDAIIIDQIPSRWGVPGLPSVEPFVVSLTSAKIDEPLCVVLQALNTKSVPHYAVPEKWNFLVPKWRFIDASTNQILDGPIPLSTTPVYKDSVQIAVKGQASFYYVDDLATGTNPTESCPLLITATLSTESFSYPPETLIYPYHSYSNSEVARAVIAWQISDVVPTDLKVTENFLNDIYPIKWAGVPIPIMVTCRFNPSTIETFSSSSMVSSTDVLSYPRTNELGGISTVDVKIIGLSSSQYIVDEAPLYFKATDESNNVSSGYVFTTVTPLVTASTASIQVSTVAHNQQENENEFPFPDGFPITPEVYISHPFESNINKVNVVTYPTNCSVIDYFKTLGVLTDGSISFVGMPALSLDSVANLQLSGTSGIYAVTYNPVKELIYAGDADQDKIYVVNINNEIIQTLSLVDLFGELGSAPSYMSIDSEHNIWISLYDRYTALKYDSSLQTLLASAVPTFFADLEEFDEGSPLIAPPIVETDKENDIWICYSHPVSSCLLKFDSNGNYVATAENLPFDSVPVSLAITKQNNVWVACRESNEVRCYNTSGNLLSSFEYNVPSHIAVDRQNNLWILHGYNLYSVLNTTTLAGSSWRIETKPELKTEIVFDHYAPLSEYSDEDLAITDDTNEIWGGLTIDVYNRVWFIDNENNAAGVFTAFTPENIRVFDVQPTASTNYILRTGDNFVTEIDTSIVRSAQTIGDWSGNRWYQKYAGQYSSVPVSGISVPFTIKDLDAEARIAKVNDSFDCANHFKSLALPEILNRNAEFFDTFLPGVVGYGDVGKEDLGRIVYEKTANFLPNHADIDTAEIDQLISTASALSVPTKTFGVDFPEEIKRLLNIFSVQKHYLRGVPNLEADINNNIGTVLTETDYVSAKQYLFMKDKQFDVFQLVYVAPNNDLGDVYPLPLLQIEGARQPLTDNYIFFQYDNTKSNGYQSNLIDWDSPNTTISYNLSTNEEWYGEDQMIELYFNNILTKRLFEK